MLQMFFTSGIEHTTSSKYTAVPCAHPRDYSLGAEMLLAPHEV